MLEINASHPDQPRSDLPTAMGDPGQRLGSAVSHAADRASDTRQRIQLRLQGAKESLGQLHESAMSKAKAAGDATDDYVHKKPWRAIGVMAGIGVIVGLLIARR